jgi:hypothetical protein
VRDATREALGTVYELGVIAGVTASLRARGVFVASAPWSADDVAVLDSIDACAPDRSHRPAFWQSAAQCIANCAHLHGQSIANAWIAANPSLRDARIYAPAERARGVAPSRDEIASALDLRVADLPRGLWGAGEAGHADLVVRATARGASRLLVVECGLHLPGGANPLDDLRTHEAWLRLIELATLRQHRQGGFADLRVSVTPQVGITFPLHLRRLYRTVLGRHRTHAKLYQGCAYARALAESIARSQRAAVEATVVASTMLGYEHLSGTCPAPGEAPSATWKVLASCAELYPGQRETTDHADDELDRLEDVRALVRESLPAPLKTLVSAEVTDGGFEVSAREVLRDHPRIAEVRLAHAAEVRRRILDAPRGELTVLALAGAPGIGKTTAVRETLRELAQGWFLLYASPRIVINGAQRARFAEGDARVCCATATARLADAVIARNRSARGFAYVSGNTAGLPVLRVEEGSPWASSVCLVDEALADRLERDDRAVPEASVVRDADDRLHLAQQHRPGVLRGLSVAVRTLLERRGELRHMAVTLTLQALRNARFEDLDPLLTPATRFDPENANCRVRAEGFAARFETVVVMLDEITGEEASPGTIQTVQRWLRRTLVAAVPPERAPRVILVLADASLGSHEAMAQYLAAPSAPARVMTSAVEGGPRPVEVSAVTLPLGDHRQDVLPSIFVRGDAYPARALTLVHRIVFARAATERGPLRTIRSCRKRLRETSEATAIRLVRAQIMEARGQVLAFVQGRPLLERVRDALVSEGTLRAEEVFLLTSDTGPAERARMMRDRDSLRLILMTSSGTRGIDFPGATSLLALLMPTAPEHNLMEFVQFAWRGRGGPHDDAVDRRLEIVALDVGDFDDGRDSELRAMRRHADLVAFAMTVRAALHTRIYGSLLREDGSRVAVIPVGRSGDEQSDKHLQRLAHEIKSTTAQYGKRPLVTRLREAATRFFDHVVYVTTRNVDVPTMDPSAPWTTSVRPLADTEVASGPLFIVRGALRDRAGFSSREIDVARAALREFLGVARSGEFSPAVVHAAQALDALCRRAGDARGYQQLVGRLTNARIVQPIAAGLVCSSLQSTKDPGDHARWSDALGAWIALTSGLRSPELGAVTTYFQRHPFSVLYDDVDPSGLDELGRRGVARAGRLANTLAAVVLGGLTETGSGGRSAYSIVPEDDRRAAATQSG